MIWTCFGVGFNNFATGRMPMADLEAGLRTPLAGIGAELLAWYGHSGNLSVRSEATGPSIGAVLEDFTGRGWAVVAFDELKSALLELDRLPRPDPEPLVRWTPGLAFHLGSSRSLGDVADTTRAVLRRLSPSIIACFKRDYLTDRGRLDSAKRLGGWGAISADLRRQVGESWTARSANVIRGLEQRSNTQSTNRVY